MVTVSPHEPVPDHQTLPKHRAEAIYAALARIDESEAAAFDVQWQSALDRARGTHSLTELHALTTAWWRRAAILITDQPDHSQALDRARQWAAGTDVPGLTWDQILERRGA